MSKYILFIVIVIVIICMHDCRCTEYICMYECMYMYIYSCIIHISIIPLECLLLILFGSQNSLNMRLNLELVNIYKPITIETLENAWNILEYLTIRKNVSPTTTYGSVNV